MEPQDRAVPGLVREPSEEMITAAMQAVLYTGNEKRELESLDSEERITLRVEVYQALRAAIDTMHGGDGIPAFAPPTCGDSYLLAERKMRLLERIADRGGRVDQELVEYVHMFVDEAGPAFARIALRDTIHMDDLEVPY